MRVRILDDFRELEAEGVNIMTCGTCLDFLWDKGHAGSGDGHEYV